ncbi:unnamed protein product [Lathyrus sativus]|nr:unnamed protein product [Lathyrus sativus]
METTLKFLPPNISDHAMLYLVYNQEHRKPPRQFKFSNCIIELPGYDTLVKKNSDGHIRGSPMFVLWHKLKRLKHGLKQFSKPLSDIKTKLISARNILEETQEQLRNDRMNTNLIGKAKDLAEAVISLNEMEWKILHQRAKIDWIRKGDVNNQYFYAAIKSRHYSNCLSNLKKSDGSQITIKPDIEDEVIKFYSNLMGKDAETINHIDIKAMRMGKQLDINQREYLTIPISENDITKALKGIGDLKAPGLGGYGAKIFKASWSIIKADVIATVKEYFETGKLYKAFNVTVVSLIPKDHDACEIKDYRPIAVYTIFYKIISKILTDRLGTVIPSVVNHNQAAFIPGQNIHNHIMLATELLKGYTRKEGTTRIMMQLDLQKAYDMVNWKALECIMKEMGFPNKFIQWIMLGITTVSYRFNIMGEYTDILQAKRGIRQGDPLSPMLFVLIMEYMNRMLVKMQRDPNFNYHAKCEKLKITNLTFADDVLLFCRGDCISLQMILRTFRDFSNSTGLIMNPNKCRIYFGGLDNEKRRMMKELSGFQEGTLPFKYLGIPLSGKKLNINHFMPLVDRIVARIHHWSSKLLSYARRIQLVKSIVAAMVQYWLHCIPLPKSVIRKIDSICRSFIWTGKDTVSRKCHVAWKRTCCPAAQGGLNLINLQIWNNVLLLKCLWNLCNKTDTLWVKWIHIHYLKGNHVMNYATKNHNSWIMRGILKQRDIMDLIRNEWDQLLTTHKFKASVFYKVMIDDGTRVVWRNLIRSNKSRPRAVFCLWQACHGKLATKDRLKRFGMIKDNTCRLCHTEEETVNHLFFCCLGTRHIWKNVLQWFNIYHEPQPWEAELIWISNMTKGKGWKVDVLKMLVAETIHNIWGYRNSIIFGNSVDNTTMDTNIIDNVIYRGWQNLKIRKHLVSFMM